MLGSCTTSDEGRSSPVAGSCVMGAELPIIPIGTEPAGQSAHDVDGD
jgi:hypothetical protein